MPSAHATHATRVAPAARPGPDGPGPQIAGQAVPASARDRRRLGGAGLRAFEAIADLWRLDEAERLRILGSPSRSTYYGWRRTAHAGGEIAPSLDTLLRISAVLGIHKALVILFERPAERLEWLRGRHDAITFGGRPPLELMTAGTQDGLLQTRRILDAARGGASMPPGALQDGPLADDEIVIL